MKSRNHLSTTVLALSFASLPLAESAHAQTEVPADITTDAVGNIRFSFQTVPGCVYRIERTIDLQDWIAFPDTIYGFGQVVDYHLKDPALPPGTQPQPPEGPQPETTYLFTVTGFDDGTAVAAWTGADGASHQAYLSPFDLTDNGAVVIGFYQGVIEPTPPELPYRLAAFVASGTKDPAFENIVTAPGEAATRDKITLQASAMRGYLVDVQNDPGAAVPPSPFDDRGNPLQQFHRVIEDLIDSNFDGVADHLQFGNNGANGDPFDNDIDDDGIPNGYDPDLWPAAQFPTAAALLSNVLINEALLTNEFTNCDEDNDCSDWVELYNPTSAAINLTNWHLSDSSGTNGRAKWTFPPGTTIGSGEFLVIWATGKDRGGIEDIDGDGVLDAGEDFNNNGMLDVPAPIHTNFSYSAGQPEPVVLSRPNPAGGTAIIVDRFETGVTGNYAAQRPDVSFGRFPSSSGLQAGYMILPTPGATGVVGEGSLGPVGQHNGAGALGFTDPPVFAAASDPPGIYEATTASAVIDPPATGGTVYFTTNSASPTRYSELYSDPIATGRTMIVRAIAAREGYIPSSSVTRSYLFKKDILGTSAQGTAPTDQQGARDAGGQFTGLLYGYPEQTEVANRPMLYGINAGAIADHKDTILDELDDAPVVSIVSTVPEFFELATGGLYPNSGKTEGPPSSDPRGREWERLCSFEIVEPGGGAFTQANAAVLITGASSILQNTTRKHNLRVKFENVYGPDSLVYPVFPGVTTPEYFNFNLKNPTHDSWSNTWSSFDVRNPATYCNEAFIMDTHRAMGHEAPHQRWSHLFINGIYWGPYLITERVDEHFMDAHYGQGDYTVVKNGGEAVDGDYAEWQALQGLVNSFPNAAAAEKPGLYAQIIAQVDMANYVDYLIAYTFAQASDWPGNNHRIGKSDAAGSQWKFIVWDAEWSLRQGTQTSSPVGTISGGSGAAIVHARLKDYQPYRDFFSSRVNRAFTAIPGDPGSGTLILATAQSRFQAAMDRFEMVLFSESSRWGDMAKPIPFTKSDPSYLPADPDKGDWDRSTNYIVNTWLPARQTPFLSALQGASLYVPNP